MLTIQTPGLADVRGLLSDPLLLLDSGPHESCEAERLLGAPLQEPRDAILGRYLDVLLHEPWPISARFFQQVHVRMVLLRPIPWAVDVLGCPLLPRHGAAGCTGCLGKSQDRHKERLCISGCLPNRNWVSEKLGTRERYKHNQLTPFPAISCKHNPGSSQCALPSPGIKYRIGEKLEQHYII